MKFPVSSLDHGDFHAGWPISVICLLSVVLGLLVGCSTPAVHEKTTQHPNGQLASRVHYYINPEGKQVQHGLAETWYENGVLASSKPYVRGEFTGKAVFYPRDQELQTYTYQHGVLNGPANGRYPNGAKKWVGNFKDGQRDGRFLLWTTDGKVIVDGVYRADQPYRGTCLVDNRVVNFDNGQPIAPTPK